VTELLVSDPPAPDLDSAPEPALAFQSLLARRR
jgi:hypothetical protein